MSARRWREGPRPYDVFSTSVAPHAVPRPDPCWFALNANHEGGIRKGGKGGGEVRGRRVRVGSLGGAGTALEGACGSDHWGRTRRRTIPGSRQCRAKPAMHIGGTKGGATVL